MYRREAVVRSREGLHTRPAMEFVRRAEAFQAEIWLGRVGDEMRYSAKSTIRLLALGLSQGERVLLTAAGSDEREAVDTLAALLECEAEYAAQRK